MSDVTILMAVHNGMPYLPQAVRSIRAQTYANWTFLIVNDGSTDGSAAHLDGLDDPRIHIIHQENQGLGPALNRGLELCATEFLARMDSDDLSHPTRIEQQLAFLRKYPEVGLLGTQIERLGKSRAGGISLLPTDHKTIYRHLLQGRPCMYHPTIMCRTELLKEIGGYWADYVGEEWDMFLRMGERTQMANLDRVLLTYRIHSASLSGANMASMRSRVAYACQCARRRQAGLAPIAYEQFSAAEQAAPRWKKALIAVDLHARYQYRLALGDVLGSHPLRGYARMAWAATCAPRLTQQRLARVLYDWCLRHGSPTTARNRFQPLPVQTDSSGYDDRRDAGKEMSNSHSTRSIQGVRELS